ncbi:MAG: hypothetical protein ABFD83_00205 [Armatimonadota bacterium]
MDQIKQLLREKSAAPPKDQVGLRGKIRKLGFYISDYPGIESADDIDWLIRQGRIILCDEYGDGYTSLETDLSFQVHNLTRSITRADSTRNHDRDEFYVIDLCDTVLGQKALRQHKFSFLHGDPNKNGRCKELPVDAYYPSLDLVIEYRERQHYEKVAFFDRHQTVSGVNRGEQRHIYDQRRRNVLPQHGITLIEIAYSDFSHTPNKRIIRTQDDLNIVRHKLAGTNK